MPTTKGARCAGVAAGSLAVAVVAVGGPANKLAGTAQGRFDPAPYRQTDVVTLVLTGNHQNSRSGQALLALSATRALAIDSDGWAFACDPAGRCLPVMVG